ncbi:hypothetical protein p2A277 (plasmid) [Aromatoleum aromaticum EbN1]|uniref:Uncharacterized protein n=1 Tax=Aromatoleum aromaticum (strain DSM 19018 / LMG 30748 / EbN1) TaxID=76114 RepID=Q5NWA3_AROAE|nr:hypothetical protein p2A277 [Aromatoleum aromaticum EbN1]
MASFYQKSQHSCGFAVTCGQREALFEACRLDAFEQQLQPRPVHLAARRPRPVRHEATRLEPLGPDAKPAAVPVQHLHLGRAPVDEHEQMPRQRILSHAVARQRIQAVEGFAHVDRAPVQMHPHRAFGKEHQPRTRCSTTPSPRSSFNSQREAPPEPSTPRSTNASCRAGPTATALPHTGPTIARQR